MAKNLIVRIDDEAEAGIKEGRYEYAKGGIIDAKTKRYVRKYDYTGVSLETGDVIVPCLTARKIDKLIKSSGLVEEALARNCEYSREAAILGLYNYQLSYEKFTDISSKLDDLKGSINEYFMQHKKTKYRKCMMDLKTINASLMRPETTESEYQYSRALNDIASFVQELLEDYESGKLDQSEGSIILINIAIALQVCAAELYVYCFQRYNNKPAAYDDWLDVVNNVFQSVKVDISYRNHMFFSNPNASTSFIERRIRLPRLCSMELKKGTENIIKFIEDSGMTRAQYLGDPKQPE